MRICSHSGCKQAAVATLTYVYADSTVVVGPLAPVAEPHSYDLCSDHATGLTAPRGWEVVRLANNFEPAAPSSDELDLLADAMRQASKQEGASRKRQKLERPSFLPEF